MNRLQSIGLAMCLINIVLLVTSPSNWSITGMICGLIFFCAFADEEATRE